MKCNNLHTVTHPNESREEHFFEVTLFNKTFYNVPVIGKCSNQKCKYFSKCKNYDSYYVRKSDCWKKMKWWIWLYLMATANMFLYLTYRIWNVSQANIGGKFALTVILFVGLDVICSFLESIVGNLFRDYLFFMKLKRLEKKKQKFEEQERKAEEEKQKAEEAIKLAEELQKREENEFYDAINSAEEFVKKVDTISEAWNFGSNDEQVASCVKTLYEILEILKRNPRGYRNVRSLFELELPEFYETLQLYSDFIKSNTETDEMEKELTKCVESFYEYLQKQKISSMENKSMLFMATSRALRNIIDGGLNK